MNKKWIKLSSVALMSLYLAACETTNDEEVEGDELSEVFEDDASVEDTEGVDEEAEDTDEATDESVEEPDDHEENDDADAEVTESLVIEGMEEHYHSGALVELTAVLEEDTEYDDWHWYSRTDEESDWEMISGQNSSDYIGEAPDESVEMRVVLYDDSHEAYAQSEPVELEIDNH